MNKLNKNIYTTYDEVLDRTIIWQDLILENTADGTQQHIQTMVIGWYYGEPSDLETEEFANFNIVCQTEDI